MPTKTQPKRSRLMTPASDKPKSKRPLVAPASDTQKAQWDGPSWPQVLGWLVELVKVVLPIVLGGKK